MDDGNGGSLGQDARRAARREAFFSTVILISLTYTGSSLPHLFSWDVGSFCPLGTPFPLPEFSSTSGTAWPRQCCTCGKGVSRPYPLRTVGLSAFWLLEYFLICKVYVDKYLWCCPWYRIFLYFSEVSGGGLIFSPVTPVCVWVGEWLCVCVWLCVSTCMHMYTYRCMCICMHLETSGIVHFSFLIKKFYSLITSYMYAIDFGHPHSHLLLSSCHLCQPHFFLINLSHYSWFFVFCPTEFNLDCLFGCEFHVIQ